MAQYLNMEEALRRLAASASIDTTNLVKTSDQLQQEQIAAQTAQNKMQQQEQMQSLLQSPAAAQLVKNYTQAGAPYGPQSTEEGGVPNALPTAVTEAGVPSGPTTSQGDTA